MKIIDLLNKIANGEELPKKIKWENTIYAYSDYDKDYLEFPFSEEEYQGLFCMKDSILTQFLDDEVEIIEEEKKIPEKLDDFNLTTYSRDDEDLGLELNYTGVSNTFNDVYFKINEIIDYLKSKGE